MPHLSRFLLLATLLVAAGCQSGASGAPSGQPTPSTAASPAASPTAAVLDGPLLTVGFRGGHCRQGSCDRTIAIDRDGSAHVTDPEPQDLGAIPADLFQEIQEQLSLADFEALGSRPFTGECPIAFDGQELIYTFHGATGEIRLASCEVELDPTHPLFAAIEVALGAVQPQ